jgi:hypothetical protein
MLRLNFVTYKFSYVWEMLRINFVIINFESINFVTDPEKPCFIRYHWEHCQVHRAVHKTVHGH